MKTYVSSTNKSRANAKSKLLLSAAAGALFCLMAVPANAGCVESAPSPGPANVTCTLVSGDYTATSFIAVALTNSGSINNLSFIDVPAVSVSVSNGAGATISTITGGFTGANFGDSFVLTNAGTVSGATALDLFGIVQINNSGSLGAVNLTNDDAVTIGNDAGATISSISHLPAPPSP